MDAKAAYINTADKLKERILALIPSRPEILTLDGPWGLFQVEGFDCGDLNPSLAQAGWALNAARHEHNERAAHADTQ